MKVCPNCQTKYPDDANFCPQETCATPQGPRRLDPVAEAAARFPLRAGDSARRRAQRRGLAGPRQPDRRRRRLQAWSRPRVAADAGRRSSARSASSSSCSARRTRTSPGSLDFGKERRRAALRRDRARRGAAARPVGRRDGRARRSIAPRRSSRRSARRCSRGRRSAWSTTTSPRRTCSSARNDEVKVINFVAPVAGDARPSSASPSTCRPSRPRASSSTSARTPTASARS